VRVRTEGKIVEGWVDEWYMEKDRQGGREAVG